MNTGGASPTKSKSGREIPMETPGQAPYITRSWTAVRQDLSLAPQLVRRFTWRGILYTLVGGGLAWASHRMIAALLVALVFMALGVMHLWHARGLRRLLRSESGG